MFAVIETGGQQFRVSQGDSIKVQKIKHPESGVVEISKVLLLSHNGEVVLGHPIVSNAVVKAEVQSDIAEKKVLVYKKKPRKGFKKLRGHRQSCTILKIKEIVYGG